MVRYVFTEIIGKSMTTIKNRQEALKYGVKIYVDKMDDPVNKAYATWPTRLYPIDKEGKVLHFGGLGPWGFKPEALG
jgi:hypothetical protein